MMGLRGTPHVELFFDNVVLEPLALLAERGQGFKLAMGALNVVRLAQVGARAVGKASHVCEMMPPTRMTASSSTRGSATSRWCSRCWPTA
jgi:hypothetical protein